MLVAVTYFTPVMVPRLKRDIKTLELYDEYPDRNVVRIALAHDAGRWTARYATTRDGAPVREESHDAGDGRAAALTLSQLLDKTLRWRTSRSARRPRRQPPEAVSQHDAFAAPCRHIRPWARVAPAMTRTPAARALEDTALKTTAVEDDAPRPPWRPSTARAPGAHSRARRRHTRRGPKCAS